MNIDRSRERMKFCRVCKPAQLSWIRFYLKICNEANSRPEAAMMNSMNRISSCHPFLCTAFFAHAEVKQQRIHTYVCAMYVYVCVLTN